MSEEYKFEKVTYEPSRLNNGEFKPVVFATNNSKGQANGDDAANEESYRDFESDDMVRVLDFDNMPDQPPNNAVFGHLEFELSDNTVNDDAPPKFPKRYFVLRGSFIFYCKTEDVESIETTKSGGALQGRYHNMNGAPRFKKPPLGVIPLERTVVEFPPGGRRCFREHAKTDARNGYEMMIRHMGRGGGGGDSSGAVTTKRRAPAYIVCDTNGQRELWKKAIVTRADAHRKDTRLRAAGSTNMQGRDTSDPNSASAEVTTVGRRLHNNRGAEPPSALERRIGGNISVLAGVLEPEEQKDIDEALVQFGNSALFEESEWVNKFFENHDEYESAVSTRKLEQWQSSIKKGLRGAVLEQYEYFVEASREMTTMGIEIATLKELVAKQVETIESMKNVSFELGALDPSKNMGNNNKNADFPDDEMERYISDEEEEDDNAIATKKSVLSNDSSFWGDFVNTKSDVTSPPITNRGSFESSRKKYDSDMAPMSSIEVPVWLDDVVEEIAAFIKECRYSDATNLLLKAKTEITDIMNQHEKLTEKKLSKKQLTTIQRILRSIDNLTNRMCERLSEGLRRKNDALRHIAKRERSDPLLAHAPLVSPVALNDDYPALQLLVKLGRPHDAATAYSTRRSLLLTECLHERPICNSNLTNSMDTVIYAAQLSHSFFNSLAMSVEGFLDLFSEADKSNIPDDQSEASSIYTGSMKTVPAHALAATCLWCDSETSKFAAAFGTKVLGNLDLSPRSGSAANAITDKIMQFEVAADLSHLKTQLRAAEEMGEYAAAGKLRKKISIQEQEENEGKIEHRVISPKSTADKDRANAIEIAAKCIDQSFDFATNFLNTIGLPLTPRLAEYLRPRLKGTEAEIAIHLEDKWEHITFNWKQTSME